MKYDVDSYETVHCTVGQLDGRTSTRVQCGQPADIEFGAGRRLVVVVGVDVVGGGSPRLDLTLHGVDDVRHGLDELTERRSQLGAWMPARQHHAVSVTTTRCSHTACCG